MAEVPRAHALAAWIVGHGQLELRSEPLPAPGAGEVLVQTDFSGISRGTERLVLEGRVPAELHQRMRVPFQGGDFPWPVKYGYSAVGTIQEVGAGVTLRPGARIFCLHPHQDAFVVPEHRVVPLPDNVPSERAVLAPNLETALNATWDAAVGAGDRVVVVGGGVVGALCAWLCASMPGTEVTLVDIVPERASLARALGAAFALPDQVLADPALREADLVFHASATAEGLATALRCAGDEAKIVELSWYGTGAVPAPLGGDFHVRRLQLVSSQVGSLPPGRRPRWTYARRLGVAVRLLADPVLDALIDGESAFADLPETLPGVVGGRSGALCHRVAYRGGERCTT